MNLKEMLQSGSSKAELIKEFEKQLNEAVEEIKKEKTEKEALLNEARTNLIEACLDYLNALEVLPYDATTVSDDDFSAVIEILKDYEKTLVNKFKSLKSITAKIDSFDPDAVIHAFLGRL